MCLGPTHSVIYCWPFHVCHQQTREMADTILGLLAPIIIMYVCDGQTYIYLRQAFSYIDVLTSTTYNISIVHGSS